MRKCMRGLRQIFHIRKHLELEIFYVNILYNTLFSGIHDKIRSIGHN